MRPRGLLLIAIVVLAACQNPYDQERRGAGSRGGAQPRAAERARGDERPPPADDRDTAPAIRLDAQATPRAAVREFCEQWANWNWRTIERQQRRLARLAQGPLARRLAAEAKLRASDRALRRDRLGVRGRVAAVDVKRGSRARDAVCVSFEQQQTDGRADLEGARHRVYLATVVQTTRGWAVRRWEPQP
jgi:hypothetical protein